MQRTECDSKRPFGNVLIATDGSPGAERAARYASSLFRTADFHIASCVDTSRGDITPSLMLLRILEEHTRKALERAAGILRDNGIEPKVAYLKGNPAKLILRYVAANGIDLLVLNRNVRHTPSLSFGRVGNILASRALCPVLFVKGTPEPSVRRILNPTDGGVDSVPAGRLAIALARHFDAGLTKFYIGSDPVAGAAILAEAEEDARRKGVTSVSLSEIVEGDQVKTILPELEDHDLVVMGKGKRSLFSRDLLCLTSREVVAVSKRPVMLVN